VVGWMKKMSAGGSPAPQLAGAFGISAQAAALV
jgi:hypothetical protein